MNKIWIASHHHNSGVTMFASATKEGAEHQLAEYLLRQLKLWHEPGTVTEYAEDQAMIDEYFRLDDEFEHHTVVEVVVH